MDTKVVVITCRLSLLLLLLSNGFLFAFRLQGLLIAVFVGLLNPLIGNLDGDFSVTHLEALQLFDSKLLRLLVRDLNKGETLASPGTSFSLAVDVVVAGLGDDLAGLGSDGERCKGFGQSGIVNRERKVGNEEKGLQERQLERCDDAAKPLQHTLEGSPKAVFCLGARAPLGFPPSA